MNSRFNRNQGSALSSLAAFFSFAGGVVFLVFISETDSFSALVSVARASSDACFFRRINNVHQFLFGFVCGSNYFILAVAYVAESLNLAVFQLVCNLSLWLKLSHVVSADAVISVTRIICNFIVDLLPIPINAL